MIWWKILIGLLCGMLSGMAVTLLAVLLGGWLVFRTKTITMPSPFLQTFQKKEKTKPHSYVSDLYNEPIDDFFDEELSPAAARLRDQKLSSEHKDNLKIVRGKK